MHHSFLYISLPSLHDYDVKISYFKFYGGHKTSYYEIFFLILNLNMVFRNSTPGEFAYI